MLIIALVSEGPINPGNVRGLYHLAPSVAGEMGNSIHSIGLIEFTVIVMSL
jgi:hypothetical protein